MPLFKSSSLPKLVLSGMLALAAGTAAMPLAAQENEQQEPGRGVARISLLNGDVAVRRADSGDYVAAAVNAPVMAQDSVSTGPRSRAEIQFDFANRLRLASNSEVRLTGIDVNRIQMEMAHGEATFSVREDGRTQVEISTPSISVRPLHRGDYRIFVSEEGETQITVRSGEAEVYTPHGTERVPAGRTLRARGSAQDPEYQVVEAIALDDWDNWNQQRDRELEKSESDRYVSHDISGAEDLDSHGRWLQDPTYGNVWAPQVDAGWAPYREGRWVWEDFYGWTWVSTDPWGWAPYHYGSWFNGSAGWCWYPGRPYEHQFWRPALVAFFGFGGGYGGGFGVGIGFGNVGWVPLAPFEVYRPWYGRGFYGGGYGRTVINNVNIVNNTNITNIYRNAAVRNGVTGVSSQDFANGRFNNRINVGGQQIRQANLVTGVVPVAPTNNALRYSDRQTAMIARANTANAASQQQFFRHTQAPAINRVPFAQQQRNLQQTSQQILSGQNTARMAPSGVGLGAPANISAGGNLARGNPADVRRGPATPIPAGSQAATAANTTGRWRQVEPSRSTVSNRAPLSSSSNSGWARFGSPSTAQPQGQDPPASRENGSSAWSRFGTPQNHSLPEPHNQPQYRQQAAPAVPQRNAYQPRSYDTGRQSYRETGYNSRPLQIAPPILQQRAPQPSYSRPSYNSSSYSAPRYSAPAPASYARQPSYSAPQQRYSAPPPQHYSAPPAQHYSAPSRAPSPSSGGGSSHSQSHNRGR